MKTTSKKTIAEHIAHMVKHGVSTPNLNVDYGDVTLDELDITQKEPDKCVITGAVYRRDDVERKVTITIQIYN